MASLVHRVGAGPAPLRLLLVSDGAEYTSEQQFAPFRRHRAELRARLGVVSRHHLDARLDEPGAPVASGFDLIGLKLGFRTDRALAVERVRRLAARKDGAPLVYFDGDDDACILWPELLEYVDLYVKKQVFRDPADYQRTFVGKSNLTHYAHCTHGTPFADDIIPASTPADPRFLTKLHLGFNIAADDKIAELVERSRGWTERERDVDVVCRASVPDGNWLRALRGPVLERLAALDGRARVLAPSVRVPQDAYYEEMRRSRVCVSPFGYGELCWRDFEAIACRCLLLKPDVGHLRTDPEFFLPFESYVPLRWDYADLEEKCLYYLQNEPERRRIVERAHQMLADYHASRRVVDQVGRLLVAAGALR